MKVWTCVLFVCLFVYPAASLSLIQLSNIIKQLLASQPANNATSQKVTAPLSAPITNQVPTPRTDAGSAAISTLDRLGSFGSNLIETIGNQTKTIQAQALAAANEADRIEMVYEFIGGRREKYMGLVGDRLVGLESKLGRTGDLLEDITVKVKDFFADLAFSTDMFKQLINTANV